MNKTKMYPERKANISAFRGCAFNCDYCAFRGTLSRQACPKCQTYTPHAHLEVLDRKPPTTKDGEFLTMSLNGDIAFATEKELVQMLLFCNKWDDRTFLLQSKNPRIFEKYADFITPNMIIGTTIESDLNHARSLAPESVKRYTSMRSLDCRKMVTIEPIMKFTEKLFGWVYAIRPEVVYIGYDSRNNHLPEPTLDETNRLVGMLRDVGIDVKEKLIRKAWDE